MATRKPPGFAPDRIRKRLFRNVFPSITSSSSTTTTTISFILYITTILCILSFLPKVLAQNNPGPRQGHCSFVFANELYIFGGEANPGAPLFSKTALPVTSFNQSKWVDIPIGNETQNVVNGGCAVTTKGLVVFIGGPLTPANSSNFTGVQTYNIPTQEWNTIPQIAENHLNLTAVFSQRHGHTVVIQNHFVVVYGGYIGSSNNLTSETFILNAFNRHDWTWSNISTENAPLPNMKTTMSVANDSIFAITAASSTNSSQTNLIYTLDTTNNQWNGLFKDLGTKYACLNSATFQNADIFMIPIGCDLDDLHPLLANRTYNLWKLDVSNSSVTPVNIKPNDPLPRIGASISVVNETIIYMYGGFNGTLLSELWTFNMSNQSWTFLGPFPIFNVTPSTTAVATAPPTVVPASWNGSLSKGQLAGIIIGSILAFLLLLSIIFVIIRRHKRNHEEPSIPRDFERQSSEKLEDVPPVGTGVSQDPGSSGSENSGSIVPPIPTIVRPPMPEIPKHPPSRQSSFSSRFREVLQPGSAISVAGPSTSRGGDISDQPIGGNGSDSNISSDEVTQKLGWRRSW